MGRIFILKGINSVQVHSQVNGGSSEASRAAVLDSVSLRLQLRVEHRMLLAAAGFQVHGSGGRWKE